MATQVEIKRGGRKQRVQLTPDKVGLKKASSGQAVAGQNDSAYMTPKLVLESIEANADGPNKNPVFESIHIISGRIRSDNQFQFRTADDSSFQPIHIGEGTSATHALRAGRRVIAGAGLTGGGQLTQDQTINLGLPSTITVDSENGTSTLSHTHMLDLSGRTLTFEADADDVLTWENEAQNLGENRVWTPSLKDHGPGQRGLLSPDTQSIFGVKKLNDDLQSEVFSSWFSAQPRGFRIQPEVGEGDFRFLYIDELIAKGFTVDVATALAGSDVLTKSIGILSEKFVMPVAVGNQGTVRIIVEDLPGYPSYRVFENGDWVRFDTIDRSGETGYGLVIARIWGTVQFDSSYNEGDFVDGFNSEDGTQAWLYTIDYRWGQTFEDRITNPLWGDIGLEVHKGAIGFDYGTSGDYYIERTVLRRKSNGLESSESPFDRIVQWSGDNPKTGNVEVITQRGNLESVTELGLAGPEYGAFFRDAVYIWLDDGAMKIGKNVDGNGNYGIYQDENNYWIPGLGFKSTITESHGALIEGLDLRVENNEGAIGGLTSRVSSTEEDIEQAEGRLDDLDNEFGLLKTDVGQIGSRTVVYAGGPGGQLATINLATGEVGSAIELKSDNFLLDAVTDEKGGIRMNSGDEQVGASLKMFRSFQNEPDEILAIGPNEVAPPVSEKSSQQLNPINYVFGEHNVKESNSVPVLHANSPALFNFTVINNTDVQCDVLVTLYGGDGSSPNLMIHALANTTENHYILTNSGEGSSWTVRAIFNMDANDSISGVTVGGMTIKQFNSTVVFNDAGAFTRVAPDIVIPLTGSGTVTSGGSVGSGAWGDIANKPFSTIGSGLTVQSNQLRTNLSNLTNGTGVSSFTYDGLSPATVSTVSATASRAGHVTTGSQTFAGAKTFQGLVSVPNATSGGHALNRTTGDGRYLLKSNNLSDLNNSVTAQSNLGLRNGTADLDLKSLEIGAFSVDESGDVVGRDVSGRHFTLDSISARTRFPVRATTVSKNEPIEVPLIDFRRGAYLTTINALAGEGDHFYCADRNPSYSITSNYPGETSLFNGNLSSGINLPVAQLPNNPWVLELEFPSISASDVLHLVLTGHNLGTNSGTLTSWKVETKSAHNQQWYTCLDRDGVSDLIQVIAVPLHITSSDYGGSSSNYHTIRGIRITVRGATESSFSSGNARISSVQLRNSRPVMSPAQGVGALDIRGGSMFGNLNIQGYELQMSGNTVIDSNRDIFARDIEGRDADLTGDLDVAGAGRFGDAVTISNNTYRQHLRLERSGHQPIFISPTSSENGGVSIGLDDDDARLNWLKVGNNYALMPWLITADLGLPNRRWRDLHLGRDLHVDRYSFFADDINLDRGQWLDDENSFIRTDTYLGGFAGSGFQLEQENGRWNMTTDNINVRRRLQAYEFLLNQLRAGNGNEIFRSGMESGAVETLPAYTPANQITTPANQITWAGGVSHKVYGLEDLFVPFTEGELIRTQVYSGRGIKGAEATVLEVENGSSTVTDNSTARYMLISLDSGDDPEEGDKWVALGHEFDRDRQGIVGIFGEEEGAPFMRIMDGVDRHRKFGSFDTLVGQFGRLDNITDPLFPVLDGSHQDTYGVWTNNVFLRENVYIAFDGGVGKLGKDAGGPGNHGMQLNPDNYIYTNNLFQLGGLQGIRRGSDGKIRFGSDVVVDVQFSISWDEVEDKPTYLGSDRIFSPLIEGGTIIGAYAEIDAGDIGNFEISNGNLIGPNTGLAGSGTWRLWVGSNTASSANFRVNSSGKLFATGADISGDISGSTITGSTITGGTISGTNVEGIHGSFGNVDLEGDMEVDGNIYLTGVNQSSASGLLLLPGGGGLSGSGLALTQDQSVSIGVVGSGASGTISWVNEGLRLGSSRDLYLEAPGLLHSVYISRLGFVEGSVRSLSGSGNQSLSIQRGRLILFANPTSLWEPQQLVYTDGVPEIGHVKYVVNASTTNTINLKNMPFVNSFGRNMTIRPRELVVLIFDGEMWIGPAT